MGGDWYSWCTRGSESGGSMSGTDTGLPSSTVESCGQENFDVDSCVLFHRVPVRPGPCGPTTGFG